MTGSKEQLTFHGIFNNDSSKKNDYFGKKFETNEERRNYFLDILNTKLSDPQFHNTEGFPIGEKNDLISLSDPPFFTICPNLWTQKCITAWENQKTSDEDATPYRREPFATDVREGKNNPIYNAHSYHTKVPYKAIMRFILHYTKPGDIIFDGFCGTGMTGIAAQMCGDKSTVESLGYQVDNFGEIFREEIDENGNSTMVPFSQVGPRYPILNDLSPIATFITYNYNTPIEIDDFETEASRILKEVEEEYGWVYSTLHDTSDKETRILADYVKKSSISDLKSLISGESKINDTLSGKTTFGRINFILWSDIFVCPECAGEVVFWDAAVKSGAVEKIPAEFSCPHCSVKLSKDNMDHAFISKYDEATHETIQQLKQKLVLINYSVGTKRFEKKPDSYDLEIIEKIENSENQYWYPKDRMIEGDESRRNDPVGLTHVHHFFTKQNLSVLSVLYDKIQKVRNNRTRLALLLVFTAIIPYASKMRRYRSDKKGGGPLSGTLYIASLITPPNVMLSFNRNVTFIKKAYQEGSKITGKFNGMTQSSTRFESIENDTIDYIFTDPPFGGNIMYSELNFIWESWLKVWTNNNLEAVENTSQGKGRDEYRQLMTTCFKEAYRILKPGRWMTVEFSNTSASVWNSIQTALNDAGFIVANVSMLDKKQHGFKAVTTPTAVKQDLVISAYKPNGGFEERFIKEASSEDGVWDFIRTHMKYLPVIKIQDGELTPILERDARILFDEMVAYFVRKGYSVPLSSPEFRLGLEQRFPGRDGMFFLPEQVAEYDRKKLTGRRLAQTTFFVSDEASAIDWLRQELKEKPQTFQELHPNFIQETQRGWSKNEKSLELSTLLRDNFLNYDGIGEIPSQIHSYLSSNWKELRGLPKDHPALTKKGKDRWYIPDPNKAADLEKLREKQLLREFELYKDDKKRLKIIRLEAVRVGFRKAWQDKDYKTIIDIANRIPTNVLEEDPKLLMYYDQAITRMGD